MDSNSTQQSSKMTTNSPNCSTSNSQPTKKPIFITLRKSGNGFTLGKYYCIVASSCVVFLCFYYSQTINGSGIKNTKIINYNSPTSTTFNEISWSCKSRYLYTKSKEPKRTYRLNGSVSIVNLRLLIVNFSIFFESRILMREKMKLFHLNEIAGR